MKFNKTLATAALAAMLATGASAKTGQGLTIYINPGHGGHESNDRNVVIEPYVQGDPNGYWESNSNLEKGLALKQMLEAKGYKVVMSRVTNTSDDDLNLSTIVRLSNESMADLFVSIHSNATGTTSRVNFPLTLFRGYDADPVQPKAKEYATLLHGQLLTNEATYWTSTSANIRGDWSFYPSWGTSGLGVLRGNTRTAILSEGSFHDYIPETYRLMNPEFCWLEAWNFRKSIDEFFGVDGDTEGVICGLVKDSHVPREGNYTKHGTDRMATVQGAKVELLDQSGKVVDTYTTEVKHPNGFFLFKKVQPGTYTIRLSAEAYEGCSSEPLTVTANNVTYSTMLMDRVRNTPPTVDSYSPVWEEGAEPVLCNTPIVLNFNWDMDTESVEKAFSISPAVPGNFTWTNANYSCTFTPSEPYATNTVYTVTLGTGACHAGGTPMTAPKTFAFKTNDRNFMNVIGMFPKNDDTFHYKGTCVEFRFDKQPNATPVISKNLISCVDSKGNKVSFNNRTKKSSSAKDGFGWIRIQFTSDLTPGEKYTVTLSKDMADKEGLTIQDAISNTFTAVDAGAAKENMNTVIDDMDDATVYEYNAAGSSNVTGATVAKGTDKLFGTAATKFTYSFEGVGDEKAEGEILFERASNAETVIKNGTPVGVHVYGDLSGNHLYLALTSEVSTTYTDLGVLDFNGWRYLEVPAETEADAQLSGIKLVRTPSQMSHKGEIYVDQIVANPAGAGVNDIIADNDEAGVTVWPNPASEYIIANGGNLILEVKLIALNGQTVRSNTGNVVNVSDVAPGNYLLEVRTAYSRTVHKVVIAH